MKVFNSLLMSMISRVIDSFMNKTHTNLRKHNNTEQMSEAFDMDIIWLPECSIDR